MAKWRRLADYFLVVGYQQDKDGTINGYVICTDRLIVSLSQWVWLTQSLTVTHSLTVNVNRLWLSIIALISAESASETVIVSVPSDV